MVLARLNPGMLLGLAPEKSFWTGLKTKGRQSYEVLIYRCERCGYLEALAMNH